MGLMDLLANCVLRPKVVHRLPGRLRIHVPALEKIPVDRKDLIEFVEAAIEVPEQIQSVTTNAATGNVLITYDKTSTTEDAVVSFLEGIAKLLFKNRDLLEQASPEQTVGKKDRWVEFVQSAMRRPLEIDSDMKVPEDALA
jgi:hypothetical protein